MSGTAANEYSLEGKVAVVTGAARGIGRATALRLARAGADVVVLDRDLDGAARYGEQLSAPTVAAEIERLDRRALAFEVDLVDRGGVDSVLGEALREFGRIDILANIAGGAITPFDRSYPSTMTVDDLDTIIDVNLRTVINVTQAAMPELVRSKGTITNLTGGSAIDNFPGGALAHYAAIKLAVLHYTRSVASELGPKGVRANCVSPGITMTARVAQGVYGEEERARIPLGRFGDPEDIAKAIEFLSSDMASYITGQCLSVCGGAVMTPN